MFVEGRRTEEVYLVYWHRHHRDHVRVTIDRFRSEPLQLVERAAEVKRAEAREAKQGKGRAHDQIWCVFDRDEHPGFADAVRLGDREGIHLAISNPCLELWFLLHFHDQTAFIDRRDAQRRVEAILRCGRVLTPAALEALTDRYDEARARAIKLDHKHIGDGSPPGSNPSSGLWKAIDQIRDA